MVSCQPPATSSTIERPGSSCTSRPRTTAPFLSVTALSRAPCGGAEAAGGGSVVEGDGAGGGGACDSGGTSVGGELAGGEDGSPASLCAPARPASTESASASGTAKPE